MNKKIITLLSISLLTANCVFADFSYVDSSDFTGDAFFVSPSPHQQSQGNVQQNDSTGGHGSMPPLKKLRIKIKNKLYDRKIQKMELAPVAPQEERFSSERDTSQYASQDQKDDFLDTTMPDGFEADEESIEEHSKRKFWQRKDKKKPEIKVNDEESIILDCQNIDYDTDTYCVVATGDVSVRFVKQKSTLKATKITYDRANNTIKAEGNVRILRGSHVITGDYIFVDLNEENALIEKPMTTTPTVQIQAEKGYVYGDKIVQENGTIDVDKSVPIYFRTMGRGPRLKRMLMPIEPEPEDVDNSLRLETRDLIITEKGDLEIISLKKPTFFKGKQTILKLPAVKLYTNKNFDFAESNVFEIGSIRGLGMYMGPGFVFEIPGGSVLKAIPMLNYNHSIGVGAVARFSSASNWTQLAYGTADSKFLLRGTQELDDHLYLQYGVNDYMREWFLGRRRPKYGASLVYENEVSTKNFLVKNQGASYRHRIDLGYYQEGEKDSHMSSTSNLSTSRFRYMAQGYQGLYSYENKEKQTQLNIGFVSQIAASIYGTGDTQVIGRVGPNVHMQYRRWMQDIGYYQSAYEDNTPMPVFDAYRYGKSNVFLREYFRLNKYLTLSWFGSINLSGDAPNDRSFQENAFYITVGPEDIKFSLGYDVERQRTMFLVEVMMDAKGTSVDYEKLEIKQDKKAKKKEEVKDKTVSNFQSPENKPVLQRAVVENVKNVEDVL